LFFTRLFFISLFIINTQNISMKHLIFLLVALLCFEFAYSQTITKTELQEIQKSYNTDDDETRAITNAVTNNDVKKLALNNENTTSGDFYFSDNVKTKGITNQESSGRCWLFASLNVMRQKVIENYSLSDFEFSQNYSFFWDQLEKANLFLEGIIETRNEDKTHRKVEWLLKNPINDGGIWNGFVNVVEKYGVVPTEAMPETNSSNNTRWMSRLIIRKLREDAIILRNMENASIEELRERKIEMLGEIYRILAINLGEPPTSFTWRYKDTDGNISDLKEYTPLSFYKEFIKVNVADYIMIMNDPSREYYKLYEIEFDRNTYEGTNWVYINLPNDVIKEFAVKSIKDNEAMYFSCDVGKQLNSEKGLLDINNYDFESLFGVGFGMNKTERISTYESGSSHGMTLVAVDLDEKEKPTKWLLENSWGSSSGFKGHLVMTDEWFDEYMFRIVINKNYISEKVLKILKSEPIMLPPWDPMFAPVQ
jgi:bleomycin hydrolase